MNLSSLSKSWVVKGRDVKGEVICFLKLHVVRWMDAVHLLSFKKHMIFRTNHKSSTSTELLFLFKTTTTEKSAAVMNVWQYIDWCFFELIITFSEALIILLISLFCQVGTLSYVGNNFLSSHCSFVCIWTWLLILPLCTPPVLLCKAASQFVAVVWRRVFAENSLCCLNIDTQRAEWVTQNSGVLTSLTISLNSI